MEGISSTHAAWAIMDEDAEQRMADTRRFFAEIGGRATTKCVRSWQNQRQPEAPAMKKLLGVVALMATAGTEPEDTWAKVVHFVRMNDGMTWGQEDTSASVGNHEIGTASARKRSRQESDGNVDAGEPDESDGNVDAGEPSAAAGVTSSAPAPAGHPFAPVVATTQPMLEISKANPLGVPKAACPPTPRVPVSAPAPYGALSEPARILAAVASSEAAEREGVWIII